MHGRLRYLATDVSPIQMISSAVERIAKIIFRSDGGTPHMSCGPEKNSPLSPPSRRTCAFASDFSDNVAMLIMVQSLTDMQLEEIRTRERCIVFLNSLPAGAGDA